MIIGMQFTSYAEIPAPFMICTVSNMDDTNCDMPTGADWPPA